MLSLAIFSAYCTKWFKNLLERVFGDPNPEYDVKISRYIRKSKRFGLDNLNLCVELFSSRLSDQIVGQHMTRELEKAWEGDVAKDP